MDRCFAILGLREDATKQQIEDAYRRRLRKYKTADYADDPEYAARKIAELKSAYEHAYRMAGGEAAPDLSKNHRPKPSAAHMKAHREDRDDGFFDREMRPERKYNKPCGLDQVMSTLENTWDGVKKTKEGHGDVKNIFVRKPKRKKSKVYEDKTKNARKILKVVAALIVLFSTVFPAIIDSIDNFSFDPEPEYGIEYIGSEDEMIHTIALNSRDYIYENFSLTGDYKPADGEEKDLKSAADEFAQKYAGKESIEEWTDYLRQTYPDDFWSDSKDYIDVQVEDILSFYKFESFYYANGFINPYTDMKINELYDYVDFLNEYYDREVSK